MEEESWKKVSYGYDAYAKKLQASLEQRSTALKIDQQSLSAKAKGKRPATGELDGYESNLYPKEHELPPNFRYSLALAKDVLGHHAKGDERLIPTARYGAKSPKLNREQMEAELKRRMGTLEFQYDQLFNWANTIRVTTGIAERALNERFDALTSNLTSRITSIPPPADISASPSTHLLSTHVTHLRSKSIGPDPAMLLRALSRVDMERPPAQVGDAARRAAREVQRAGDSNVGLTVPTTPNRRPPGTPRRGATPSRG
jgi:kinetochore protein Mis13/DSN1